MVTTGDALLRAFEKGHKGKYISDFGDGALQHHKQFICVPHLGASTEEAEDNCAQMAADQVNIVEDARGSPLNVHGSLRTAHCSPLTAHH